MKGTALCLVDFFEVDLAVVAVADEDVVGGSPKMSSRFAVDQFRLKPY